MACLTLLSRISRKPLKTSVTYFWNFSSRSIGISPAATIRRCLRLKLKSSSIGCPAGRFVRLDAQAAFCGPLPPVVCGALRLPASMRPHRWRVTGSPCPKFGHPANGRETCAASYHPVRPSAVDCSFNDAFFIVCFWKIAPIQPQVGGRGP